MIAIRRPAGTRMSLGYRPVPMTRGPSPLGLTPWSPRMAQAAAANQTLWDNPYVSLPMNLGAALVGFMAGQRLSGIWSTVGYLVAGVAGLRAASDFQKAF